MNNFWVTVVFYVIALFFILAISQIGFALFRLYSNKKVLNIRTKLPSIFNFLYFFDKKNIDHRYFNEEVKPLFLRSLILILIGVLLLTALIIYKA